MVVLARSFVLILAALCTASASSLRIGSLRQLKNQPPMNAQEVEADIAKDVKKLEGMGLSSKKAEKKAKKHEMKRAKMEEKDEEKLIQSGKGSAKTLADEKSLASEITNLGGHNPVPRGAVQAPASDALPPQPACRVNGCILKLIDPCPIAHMIVGVPDCIHDQLKPGLNCVFRPAEVHQFCPHEAPISTAAFQKTERCMKPLSAAAHKLTRGLAAVPPTTEQVYHAEQCDPPVLKPPRTAAGGKPPALGASFSAHAAPQGTVDSKHRAGAAVLAVIFIFGLVLSCGFLYCGGAKIKLNKKSAKDGASLLPSGGDDGAEEPRHHSLCRKICFVVSFPFLWLFLPVYLYLFPCLYYSLYNTVGFICCWAARVGNKKKANFRYTDDSFYGDDALGETPDQEIEWKWAYEISGDENEQESLFGKGINCDDIAQGSLGDCWLLSGIACLAEFPGAVQSVFVTRERSFRSKYTVRIWSNYANKWVYISVDDRIPCVADASSPSGWKPLYCMIKCKTEGKEHAYSIWSLVLEKAFAKYCGSYKALDGGSVAWALQALTGDKVKVYDREDGRWTPAWIEPGTGTKEKPRDVSIKTYGKATFDDEEFFYQLLELDRKEAVMGAGSKSDSSKSDTVADSSEGVVAGHAYTIKDVQEVKSKGETFRLLQLRNPWGSFEWKGDWSDGSDMWEQHPGAKSQCHYVDADDGLFWMELSDFVRFYDSVDVCYRTVSIADTHLELHEDKGLVLGTCFGCVQGSLNWYLCCGGVNALCFPVDYDGDVKEDITEEVHSGLFGGLRRKAGTCILVQ